MIATLISVGATFLLTGAGVVYALGRNVQALTQARDQVMELRATAARTLERIGGAEADIKAILARLDEQREFSGRVQR